METVDENYFIKQAARLENLTMRLMSRGRVGIEVSEEGMKIVGDKKDVEFYRDHFESSKIVELLDYFGHELIKDDEEGNYSGAGIDVMAFTELVNGNIEEPRDMWNDIKISFKK